MRTAILALLLASPLAAQLPRALPETVGMSTARLARIGPLLREAVDSAKVAGIVTLVARDGKLVAVDSAGYLDREDRTPMRSQAIFRLASMSKAVTSVAAMILVEEGRLLLTDPVARYIPEFRTMRVAVNPGTDSARFESARRGMTVRDLLTHRSGITYGFADGPVARMYRDSGVSDGIALDNLTNAENARRIARLPLVSQPGSRYNYSLSTDVLGRVVEVASGLAFDRFLEQRLFQPLRMDDTFFWVPDDRTARIATPYLTDSTGALTLMADPIARRGNVAMGGKGSRGSQRLFSGGAGLFGTTGDYARFLQMLLNQGELDGVRILGPKTVELLTATNQLGDLTTKTIDAGVGFSLGFSLVLDPGLTGSPTSAGTYAWGGAYGTSFWVDPKERLVIVLMQQNPTMDRRVRDRFLNLVYQAVVR